MKEIDLIVHNAAQLLTMEPGLSQSPQNDKEAVEVGMIPEGAVAIHDGKVVEAGDTETIFSKYKGAKTIDASGMVVSPGLVDPHTHAIFAGSRHLEFAMRMKGDSYMEILAGGGGIHSTVSANRHASQQELIELAHVRMSRALHFGVTTMEIKSGYGLDADTEKKMLRAARALNLEQPVRIVSTFLGAHVVPKEYADNRSRYVDLLVREIIPDVAQEKLAVACDVFLDEGAFTRDEADTILRAAVDVGMRPKIHAGQFTDQRGPELIAELGGLSADHLEVVSDEGVRAMAKGDVVATLLPGAAFSLRDNFPNGRRYIDAGVTVAIATDNNPGSSRTENLPLMASMGVATMGLTCAEAWRAITVNAAKALDLQDTCGSIKPGQSADLVLLAIPDFRAFLYHFGVNHARTVIAAGKVVFEGATK